VARVVHADLPAEHKSYLHRSGRTARAGNSGTVVTLITREQVREAKRLAKAAGITPVTTRVEGPSHPVLLDLAPGERVLSGALEATPSSPRTRSGGGTSGGGNRNRRRSGRGRAQSGGSRTPKESGQSSSTGGSGRPRRRRTPSGGGSHSSAGFSSSRR
jgi:superfamily II DNA/RNA helicase